MNRDKMQIPGREKGVGDGLGASRINDASGGAADSGAGKPAPTAKDREFRKTAENV